MDFRIFTSMWNYISSAINSSISGFGSGLVTFVIAPLSVAAVIYFLLLGFAVLRGAIQAPLRELVFQAGKVGFAFAAASSVGYTTFVVNTVTNLPDQIISAGSGTPITNPGTTFDNYVADTLNIGKTISDQSNTIQGQSAKSWHDFAFPLRQIFYLLAMWSAIFAIYLSAAISGVIGFCIVIYAKLSVSICVALAPLALACILFNSSRWFFDGWLRQTINYIILLVIMAIITKFVTGLETQVTSDLMSSTGSGSSLLSGPTGQQVLNIGALVVIALATIIIYLAGTWFFFQAPSIAAGIAGGSASGGHGFIQTGMDRAASAATRKLLSGGQRKSQSNNSQGGSNQRKN